MMAINQVIYGGETLMDVTDSTVTEETLAEGAVAYNAAGERIVGNASYIPVPAYAAVGQTIKVSAVDANGKPTAWEAVDLPSGGGGGEQWRLIHEFTIPEDASVDESGVVWMEPTAGIMSRFAVTSDKNGNPFSVRKMLIWMAQLYPIDKATTKNLLFSFNTGSSFVDDHFAINNAVAAGGYNLSLLVECRKGINAPSFVAVGGAVGTMAYGGTATTYRNVPTSQCTPRNGFAGDTITSVCVKTGQMSLAFHPGCIVKIWGCD